MSIRGFRPTGKDGNNMSKSRKSPRIPLFSESKEPHNYDIYVYGSDSPLDKERDTFSAALGRYLSNGGASEKKISARKLSALSGVSKTSIYYYLRSERGITYNSLCALCIALRLHPIRQKHLFCKAHVMMPTDEPYPNMRDKIIRCFLDCCAFQEKYTVNACNIRLIANDCEPLTHLISVKDGEQ